MIKDTNDNIYSRFKQCFDRMHRFNFHP